MVIIYNSRRKDTTFFSYMQINYIFCCSFREGGTSARPFPKWIQGGSLRKYGRALQPISKFRHFLAKGKPSLLTGHKSLFVRARRAL